MYDFFSYLKQCRQQSFILPIQKKYIPLHLERRSKPMANCLVFANQLEHFQYD